MYGKTAENRAIAFCVLLACLTTANPSLANEDTDRLRVARQFAEPATALDLEDRIFNLVRSEDKTGLQRLAEEIETKDGSALTAFAEIADAAQGTMPADDRDLARLALLLGPCHYANFLVREVALLIAEDGTEAIMRNDVIEIDGAQVDDLYAQMITDCERLKGQPVRKVKIGQLAP